MLNFILVWKFTNLPSQVFWKFRSNTMAISCYPSLIILLRLTYNQNTKYQYNQRNNVLKNVVCLVKKAHVSIHYSNVKLQRKNYFTRNRLHLHFLHISSFIHLRTILKEFDASF